MYRENSQLNDREKYIIYLLGRHERVSIQQLCDTFHMAPSSIRKVLRRMEERGYLIRTHGGAASVDSKRDDTLEWKMSLNIRPKKAIASEARRMIKNGDTIAVGDGSTIRELCVLLRHLKNSIVMTDSIVAANVLMNASLIELRVCGGIVQSRTGHIVGPAADAFFESTRVDKAFIGADGINLTSGVCSSNILLSQVERSMINNAAKRIVLCDHSKIGRESVATIAPLSGIDILITDDGANPDLINQIEEHGVEVVVVPTT